MKRRSKPWKQVFEQVHGARVGVGLEQGYDAASGVAGVGGGGQVGDLGWVVGVVVH